MRDAVDRTRVLADQVELLYRQSPVGIAVTVVVGFVVMWELNSARERDLIFMWGALTLMVAIGRAFLAFAYHNAADRDSRPDVWLRRFAIGALATGVNWGLAGAVFFPAHTDEQQVFLAFILAGMAAGGLPIFSAVWWVFAIYAASVVLPFLAVILTYGSRLFYEIAALVPVFLAVNIAVAYRLNRVFVSAYRLRVSYGKLTDDYTLMNQRLERQLIELEEARMQVESSGRKLALFAERAPIAVIELSADGRIQQINREAENLFGYSQGELAGTSASIRDLVHADQHEEFDGRWKRLIEERESLDGFRMRNPRRDGVSLVCEWTVTPLVNAEGTVLSVIAQGRNITQQLEAERLKQEFTSTLSHELRTPLTSIIGSLQLINSGMLGDLNKDQTELTEVAERNGIRLLDLINDILDIEKVESGKLTLFPETIALDELVREALKLNQGFAERYKVKLVAHEPLPALQVHADRKRLLQVMTNLLSNAAKFSPADGEVEVEMREKGGDVLVTVSDRGSGIPENFRARIFGRFAQADSTDTRAKGGTGLGLAICKRMIELMEGTIGFANREGGGTTFWFELPKHVNTSKE
ncbi:MAG: PAS domain S-box protein [Betaproteobacteria bacterium]|nr:PAS domain S-box protein [Betaproteobacteria bacterium]